MRGMFAVALMVLGFAGLTEAGAADFPAGRSANYGGASAAGVRAPQLMVYDDQPGVYVRAYWRAPWANRHYYPFTGKRPKVGRREYMSVRRAPPQPAETYYREWSTTSFPAVERPRIFVEPREVEPQERFDEPPRYPEPLK